MILFMSPLARVALSNPAPNLDRAVVCPENPLANAMLTSSTDLPVPADISNARAKAFWLLVKDPLAVSKV